MDIKTLVREAMLPFGMTDSYKPKQKKFDLGELKKSKTPLESRIAAIVNKKKELNVPSIRDI